MIDRPDNSGTASTLRRTVFDSDIHAAAISVRGLNHYFGEGELRRQVLHNNNLDVREGEIVIMTGPSGSGKTTLLTLIGTLRTVMEGSLEVAGHQLFGANPGQLLQVRRELGFIFQAHNLFESLTAFENVRMAMELFDHKPREMTTRIVDLLSRLGLKDHVHKKPAKMSGGQKQRVAIARGLIHNPRVVLADEPTAALDEATSRDVVTLFQDIARSQGTTIIMVTHDNRILDVADRIVNMVEGRVRSDVLVHEASVIAKFLKQCEVFSRLSAGAITDIADRMKPEKHPPGSEIIHQGEQGDKFYLIRRGTVDVIVNGVEKRATMADGDFFGEAALITGRPRNATVVATSEVHLYALGKQDFQRALEGSATFEEEVRRALFERQ